jgi:hypothetical protein
MLMAVSSVGDYTGLFAPYIVFLVHATVYFFLLIVCTREECKYLPLQVEQNHKA